jgi:hypothetical protein
VSPRRSVDERFRLSLSRRVLYCTIIGAPHRCSADLGAPFLRCGLSLRTIQTFGFRTSHGTCPVRFLNNSK